MLVHNILFFSPFDRKREPHNYDKVQNTAHQTLLYNQMIAQQQQPPAPATAQMYNSSPYGNLTDVTNINHMSPIQTTTNNFTAAQNALNLSNTQMYAKNILLQQQASMQNQMSIEQQQPMSTAHEINSNSYKSPQSPSFRSYHHSNQQPYKIPSQSSTGYNNATSRIILRQQSPPHQMSGQMCKSMSFQQQQQQQQNASVAAAMKEMYRSNSLPINANIQLPKDMMGGNTCENFAIPKYPSTATTTATSSSGKGRNSRSRSNSINLRHNQLIMTPIQSATSEPALNASSALAQLLTNSSNASLIGQKAHSISSSAMSMQQQQMQPQRANSFTSSSLVQNSILMAVASAANKQQQASSTSSTPMYQTPSLSPESTTTYHDSHEHPSLSPERCISMGKYSSSRESSNRRAGHIHAEQKRRYNIKNGFDMLHSLIPQLQQNPNAKVSKISFEMILRSYVKFVLS
jgi:MAX-like protein X